MKIPKKALIIGGVIILVIIIIAIVSGNQQQNSSSSNVSTADGGYASLKDDAGQSSGQAFVFEQLGVTIDVPKGLEGLRYTEGPTSTATSPKLYITSSDFEKAADACGEDGSASYFSNLYIISDPDNASDAIATVDGKRIGQSGGRYEVTCTGADSERKAQVLSASLKLIEEAFKTARSSTPATN